ncbi:50S ribosomal protein L21 [Candidatus Parcubacteria bacterium]|nr:50S ribosomal protein L21 [Candidatus Parcubacteria bacterium]
MAETTATKKPKAPKVSVEASQEPTAVPAPTKKASKKEYAYAVIVTGGKQYRVAPGQTLKIEKMIGEYKEGDTITFDQVLLADDGGEDINLGMPIVSGVSVTATLKKIGRYKTIDVIKYKQKSRYFKKNGHRQPYFEVVIDSIK